MVFLESSGKANLRPIIDIEQFKLFPEFAIRAGKRVRAITSTETRGPLMRMS